MVGGPSVALWRDIQTLFDGGTVGGMTDRQLLERFTLYRDASSEAAFDVLVRRHGPMVLRVCRNVLKDWNDAEDAFQATFIVLARRCGSIHKRDSIESWLFGVACRVAARARVEAARRRAVERRGAAEADSALGPPREDEADRFEIGPLVQEEVHRLPEKYRAAVVLCYWEGLTQEQAAAQLGCPLGTVRSRLARARDLLRRRLDRRGVASLTGAAVPGFDFSSIVPIPATLPESWVASAVKAVTNIAAGTGPATAGAASASVGVLVHSVLRSLLMMKLKTIAICLSFIGLGTAGVILAAPQVGRDRPAPAAGQGRQVAQRRSPQSAADAEKRKVEPPLRLLPSYVIEPPDILVVEVLEALPGRPISGERLVRPDGKISLGFYGELDVAGLTTMEAKEKIVIHLQKWLSDQSLGLTIIDGQTGAVTKQLPPKDSDRVFVDVTKMNSKNYYVVGSVGKPGRLPLTGYETVLDAINLAGGLSPEADHDAVYLYRKSPPEGTLQRLPVNIDQIVMGGDPTTNYQLFPGDRLVVPARPGAESAIDDAGSGRPSIATRERSAEPHRVERRPPVSRAESPDDGDPRRDDAAGHSPTLRDVERRLGAVERKLDRVLDALERRNP
jgi:polysaccharide export outer membrane protein